MADKHQKVEVFVEGEGLTQMILVEVAADDPIEYILDAAKAKGLIVEADSLVFVNKDEANKDRSKSVVNANIKKHNRIHVHRCVQVHVTVNYQKHHKQHPFRPFATVGDVRDWAMNLNEFSIDPGMRVNMILRLCGTAQEPELDVQIGTLAKHGECAVCFDFVVDPRFQGKK